VYPTGIKSYAYQYRTPQGVKRRYTICQIGELTPDQARKKAEELRHTVREGKDPLHQKQTLRHAETVGDLLDRYLASQDFADKAPSTQAINRGRIERHLRPLFGRRHAHLVTDGDIKRALADIRDGKTAADIKTAKGRARVRGGAGTAREAIALLRVVF